MQESLPSGPGWASRTSEQLIIESSPLLRGEREDMALLEDETERGWKHSPAPLTNTTCSSQRQSAGRKGFRSCRRFWSSLISWTI
jgi:hypothetical protein